MTDTRQFQVQGGVSNAFTSDEQQNYVNADEPALGVWHGVTDRLRLLGEHYNMGEDEVAEGYQYWQVLKGFKTYEEATANVNRIRSDKAGYRSIIESTVPQDDWMRRVLPAVESLALMKHMMEASQISAAGGAGVGATAGLAASAPEGFATAPLFVPALAALGASTGGIGGGFTYVSSIMAGQKLRDLMAKNPTMDQGDARNLALLAGSVNGMIETMQQAVLSGLFKSAATGLSTAARKDLVSTAMKNGELVKLSKNGFMKYLGAAGIEGLEEGSQSWVDDFVDWMANLTLDPQAKFDLNGAITNAIQKTALGTEAGLYLGAGAVGGGKLARVVGERAAKSPTPIGKMAKDLMSNFEEARKELIEKQKAAVEKLMLQGVISDNPQSDLALERVLGKVITTTGQPSKPTNTEKALEEAEEKLSEAREKAHEAREHVEDFEDANPGIPVPERLIVERRIANRKLARAKSARDQALLEHTLATAAKKHRDPAVSEVEKAQLANQIGNLENKLRQAKVEAVEEEANRRLTELDEEIKQIEADIALQEDSAKMEEALNATKNRIEEINTEIAGIKAGTDPLSQKIDALKEKIKKREAGKVGPVPLKWRKQLENLATEQDDKLKDLRQQLKDLETSKRTVKQNKQERAALSNRLQEALRERNDINELKDAIDNDLLTDADLVRLGAVATPARRHEIIWAVIDNALDLMKKSSELTAEAIKENQRLVETYLAKSGLSADDIAKFKISSIQSAADLQRELPNLKLRVRELLAKASLRDAVLRLQRRLLEIEPNAAGKSKFSADKDYIANLFRLYIESPNEAINELRRSVSIDAPMEDKADSGLRKQIAKLTLDLVAKDGDGNEYNLIERLESEMWFAEAKLDMAEHVYRNAPLVLSPKARAALNAEVAALKAEVRLKQIEINEAKTRHAQQLTYRLTNLLRMGRDERAEKEFQKHEDIRQLAEQLGDTAQGDIANKRLDETLLDKDPDSLPNRLDKLRGAKTKGRAFGVKFMTFKDKMLTIFQDAKNPEKLAEILNNMVRKAHTDAEANKRKQTRRLFDLMKQWTGLKESQLLELMAEAGKRKIKFSFIGYDGSPQEFSRTLDEAWQIWMQMDDPSLADGLQYGNNFTLDARPGSTRSMLANAIFDESQGGSRHSYSMANAIKQFYNEQYFRLGKYFKDATGLTLSYNPDYSGFAWRGEFREEEIAAQFEAQLKSLQPFSGVTAGRPGSTNDRIQSRKRLVAKSAVTNVLQSIGMVEHYGAWQQPSEVLSRVFNDGRVKNIIRLKYGDAMYGSIVAHLEDMTKGYQQRQMPFFDVAMKVVEWFGFSKLALKPQQYVKQISSIVNFALHIPVPDLVAGIKDYYDNQSVADAVIESSEAFQNRYSNFGRTISSAVYNSNINAFKESQVKDTLLFFMRQGDQAVVRAGAWAVHKYWLNKTGNADTAMRKMDEAYDTTQSSGNIYEVSDFGREPGWMRLVSIFTQQPIRMFTFQLNAWRKFANHPTGANLYQAARTSMVTHLAQAAFVAVDVAWLFALPYATDEEKEGALFNWLMSFLWGPEPPYVSEALTDATVVAYNLAQKKRDPEHKDLKDYDFKFILTDMFNSMKAFSKRAIKMAANEDEEPITLLEWAQLLADAARAIPVLPIDSPIREIKRFLKAKEAEE